MKNIHVLPTDKPSSLYEYNNKLFIGEFGYNLNRNIYITSDEEIKEGDYCINKYNMIFQIYGISKFVNNEYHKKIILTTDQDLIKDGVQAIDDEFLEWFVNNSSCEEVKVVLEKHSEDEWIDDDFGGETYTFEYENYKIIIPKEESKQQCKDCNDNLIDCTCIEDTVDMKQETLTNDTDSHSWGFENFEVIKTEEDAKIFVETMENIPEPNDKLKRVFRDFKKQETLEEVAEEHSNEMFSKNGDLNSIAHTSFTKGAKWQQEQYGLMEIELNHTKTLLASCEKALKERDEKIEQMYSEEEVKHLMTLAFEQGFKKADVVEAGLEAKETDTEINWIFLKHKK